MFRGRVLDGERGWWRYERRAGNGRDVGDDDERGRLHQLTLPTDKEPTYRQKQVHENRLHDRIECVKLIKSNALLLPC